jgi:alkylhydroperoxidase family enzyme
LYNRLAPRGRTKEARVGDTSPRIEPLPADAAKAAAESAGVLPRMAELSVFRVLLRQPGAAKAVQDLLVALLFRGALDARLRELLIMRIGWATGSVYEWTQHWRVARELGVPAEDLLAVRAWRSSERLDARDRAVLAATDETLADGVISDATWREICRHLATDAERVELVAAIGCWRMISSLLRSLEVPLEEGVAAWPPDGAAPELAAVSTRIR